MIQELAKRINKEEIKQYCSFLESIPFSIDKKEIIEPKIGDALEKIQGAGELDTIIKILENLQKEVDSIARSNSDNQNNFTIILPRLSLSLLRDFYSGIQSLEKMKTERETSEISWPVLYHCVDRLETVLARVQQIQNLTSIEVDRWDNLVTFIEGIFQKILLEIDNCPEEEQFNNERVAIRRILWSGFQLSRWIREQSEVTRKMRSKEKALQELQQRVEARKSQEPRETRGDRDLQNDFYKIMDSFRSKSWKLYTDE